MKVNKDILSIYEEILTNNKNILSELELVQLNDTNYSNLKYDNDGTQSDSVNKPLLDDIDEAAKAAGLTATVTTASTGHPANTVTGNPSRHGQQTAVDIAILNGIGAGGASTSSNGNAEFRSLGNKLANALVSMGYVLNTESGNSKAVLWQTNTGGNHFNHLHVSNNSGESGTAPVVDSNTSTVDSNASEKAYNNATGKSNDSTGSFWSNGGTKDTYMQQTVQAVANKLLPGDKGLKEQRDFGNDITNRYGRIIIPKDTNSKIKSPTSGVVDNSRYVSGCVNQIIISTKSKHYLQFCGISKPLVRNGQSISIGTLLGTTDTDVEVTMFDNSWSKVPIESNSTSSLLNKNSKDDKKND